MVSELTVEFAFGDTLLAGLLLINHPSVMPSSLSGEQLRGITLRWTTLRWGVIGTVEIVDFNDASPQDHMR